MNIMVGDFENCTFNSRSVQILIAGYVNVIHC